MFKAVVFNYPFKAMRAARMFSSTPLPLLSTHCSEFSLWKRRFPQGENFLTCNHSHEHSCEVDLAFDLSTVCILFIIIFNSYSIFAKKGDFFRGKNGKKSDCLYKGACSNIHQQKLQQDTFTVIFRFFLILENNWEFFSPSLLRKTAFLTSINLLFSSANIELH